MRVVHTGAKFVGPHNVTEEMAFWYAPIIPSTPQTDASVGFPFNGKRWEIVPSGSFAPKPNSWKKDVRKENVCGLISCDSFLLFCLRKQIFGVKINLIFNFQRRCESNKEEKYVKMIYKMRVKEKNKEKENIYLNHLIGIVSQQNRPHRHYRLHITVRSRSIDIMEWISGFGITEKIVFMRWHQRNKVPLRKIWIFMWNKQTNKK